MQGGGSYFPPTVSVRPGKLWRSVRITRNFKLTVAYDGTRYQGWQRLGSSDNTLQQRIETILSRVLDAPIEISGSGRTDAGTHARAQVASFRANTQLSAQTILARLRHQLPEDIGALSLEEVDARFHARLWAKRKTYVYRVWNSELPNVFEQRFQHQLAKPLDVEKMDRAAQFFVGTHDFLAFCANKHFKKSSVRTIEHFSVERLGEEVRFTVTADGFLYNMVRILVGTLLEIGQDLRQPEALPEIFASRRREHAGETAPARGLCLWEVEYE